MFDIIMKKAEEVFGSPVPGPVLARLEQERKFLEDNNMMEELVYGSRVILKEAKDASLPVFFDPRFHYFVSCFLLGLSSNLPIPGYVYCGECRSVEKEENDTKRCCCGGRFWVNAVALPFSLLPPMKDSLLRIRIAPQHYQQFEKLIANSRRWVLAPDKQMGRLADVLAEADLSFWEIPVCTDEALDVFERVLSRSEQMGAMGCLPDCYRYRYFPLLEQNNYPLSFAVLVRIMAMAMADNGGTAAYSDQIRSAFETNLPADTSAEDLLYHLFLTGQWEHALELADGARFADERLVATFRPQYLPAPGFRFLLEEETSVASKIYALDELFLSLKMAWVKQEDPVSFYRALIRRAEPIEIGVDGEFDRPDYSAADVVWAVEKKLLDFPRSQEDIDGKRMMEILIEYEEKFYTPNIGWIYLVLYDLDQMGFVEDVFRGKETELHLTPGEWNDDCVFR